MVKRKSFQFCGVSNCHNIFTEIYSIIIQVIKVQIICWQSCLKQNTRHFIVLWVQARVCALCRQTVDLLTYTSKRYSASTTGLPLGNVCNLLQALQQLQHQIYRSIEGQLSLDYSVSHQRQTFLADTVLVVQLPLSHKPTLLFHLSIDCIY